MFLEVLRTTAGVPFRKFRLWIVIEVRSSRYNNLTRIFDNHNRYLHLWYKQQLCKVGLFPDTEYIKTFPWYRIMRLLLVLFYSILHIPKPRQILDWSDQGRLSVEPREKKESHARKPEKEVSWKINESIISKWVWKKWDGEAQTEFI